jgi:hypothetical protein
MRTIKEVAEMKIAKAPTVAVGTTMRSIKLPSISSDVDTLSGPQNTVEVLPRYELYGSNFDQSVIAM